MLSGFFPRFGPIPRPRHHRAEACFFTEGNHRLPKNFTRRLTRGQCFEVNHRIMNGPGNNPHGFLVLSKLADRTSIGARMNEECFTWLNIVQCDSIAFLERGPRAVFDFHGPDPVFPTHFQNKVDFRVSGSSIEAR